MSARNACRLSPTPRRSRSPSAPSTLAGVEIAALDIGGGFPAAYAGEEPPPFHWYFDMIKEALANLPPEPAM